MIRACLFVSLLLVASPARSDDKDPNEPYSSLVGMVSNVDKNINGSDCSVAATIDFHKYQEKLAVFREAWLNRDQSLDFYAMRGKQVLSYIVLKHEAELITEGLYNGSKLPECRFTLSIAYPDKFGQQKLLKAVTWRFNEEQAGKVNWEKFDPKDFNEVALNYRLNPDLADWFANEPKLGDEKAPPNGGEPNASASAGECDMLLFNANAVFIRATTFCKKDYMDSKEGLAALAGARQCMGLNMGEAELKQKVGAAMLTLDRIARERGRSAVCPFVEQVARQVRARTQ